jgi:tRNA(Met) cytidine acetyltransferase
MHTKHSCVVLAAHTIRGVISLREDVLTLLAQAKRSRQRRMLRLYGERTWLREQVVSISALLESPHTLRGDALIASDGKTQRARDRLGEELAALIVDSTAPVNADALGAALGMVKGGGLVVWLEEPTAVSTPFGLHLRRAANEALGTIARSQSADRSQRPVLNDAVAEATRFFEWGACTYDQERAVSALLGLLDRSAQPVVLTAHRGRGKSTALGLFVSSALSRDTALRIAVTASQPRGTATLLAQVAAQTPDQLTRVRVAPAFELAQGRVDADVVLVDEAAGLSVELLSGILAHYRRVAFATTVHGYEGSGQGFRVRFMARLARAYPRTREVFLDTPVRWQPDDPVEAFAARALVLDAPSALDVEPPGDDWSAQRAACAVTRLERAALRDEKLLRSLFGTFVLAHYRTTPSDLVHLLDDDGVRLWVVREDGDVSAALWAVEEGGFDAERAIQIAHGTLRPRGHMLPEAFARHLHEPLAARARGLRIVRIAVAPRARRTGIGRSLLAALLASASADGFDYVGAGFAATADVIAFWQASDLSLVHIGTKRGAASGEVSALVVRGVTGEFAALITRLRQRFLDELSDRLRDGLADLTPDVVACAWPAAVGPDARAASHEDRQRIDSYLKYAVPYESVVSALHRFVLARAASGAFQPLLEGQALLIAKVLQARSWPEIRRLFRYASVAEAMRAVRRALAEEHADDAPNDDVM